MPFLLIGAAILAFIVLKNKNAGVSEPGGPGGPGGNVLPPDTGSIAAQVRAQQNAGLAIAGVASAGVSAALASLGYLSAAGPIGAAVAGAIAAITLLRGTTHLVANEFVQAVQNPFGRYLAQIVDYNDQLVREGNQTAAGSRQAYEAVQVLWSEFQVAANEFKARSSQHKTVIDQSFAELNGPKPAHNAPYFMNLVLSNLERDVQDLSSGAVPRAR